MKRALEYQAHKKAQNQQNHSKDKNGSTIILKDLTEDRDYNYKQQEDEGDESEVDELDLGVEIEDNDNDHQKVDDYRKDDDQECKREEKGEKIDLYELICDEDDDQDVRNSDSEGGKVVSAVYIQDPAQCTYLLRSKI